MMYIGVLAGLATCMVFLALKSAFRVEEGQVAALTRFGAARRGADKRLRLYGPGLHAKQPWDRVHVTPLMEQIVDLSNDEDGRTAMAEDGTVLRFDPVLRYSVEREHLDRYLFDLENPAAHVNALFTCLLRNEIANFRDGDASPTNEVAGSYAVIRRGRKKLSADIAAFCNREMSARYGVRFHAVDLADILAPDELAEALNAVMSARAEADAQYARAEAEADQRVLASRRGVEIAREKARAVEQEIGKLAEYLSQLEEQGTLELYVARRRAEVLSQSKTLYLRSM